ncbi:MAG: nuclease-related domain-containing protein [Propionivibrio sp.]
MIYKELDPFCSEDRFAQSGRAAEEKMAFYLKRHFGNIDDVLVLNGVRLQMEDDAAQVDHLVIHAHGLTVVESKSVHGKVQIKDDGQWIRWFSGNQSKGMASPEHQARLQADFFRGVLGKASKNNALIDQLPIDVLVAISDEGEILWPNSGPIAGVCKADQVADKIKQSRQEKEGASIAPILNDVNRQKIADFLVAAHRPLSKSIAVTARQEAAKPSSKVLSADNPPAPRGPASGKECKHCGSTTLEIRYAHSYFLYCAKCEKNTAIKVVCPSCSDSMKLRKQKQDFFIECSRCSSSRLYHTNP